MIGLVLKDILVLRKTAKLYLFILAFYLVLTLTGAFDQYMVIGFVALFTMMLPLSSFSFDELARWDKYAATLPISRRGIVGSKYLLSLVLGAAAEMLTIVMTVILMFLKEVEPGEMMLAGLIFIAIGLLINSIMLPLLFQFGAEKGRLFTMLIFAFCFLTGFSGAKLLGEDAVLSILLRSEGVLCLSVIVVALLALFVSYRISLHIYGKKDL